MSDGASPDDAPHPLTPARASRTDAHDHEEDVRTKQALLTAIVLLVLFGAGFWIVQELHKSMRAHQCLEQGRRNCAASEIRVR